jgi:Bacterial TSP3 repeat
MKRLIFVAVSLSLGLGGLSGSVVAQTQSGVVVMDDASGTDGTNGACNRRNRGACSDVDPDNGITITEPPVETPPVPTDVAPPPAPAPEPESAPETTDMAVATATDQDADNAPDELEPGLGLDPTNPDTDGDHVADGDELNLYGTDPLNGDTDGDGVSDGEELFATRTDPLA